MAISTVSSNPILNNPTFQKTQTRETPADVSSTETPARSNQTTGGEPSQDESVSLNISSQSFRTEQTRESRPTISPREAERTANSLKQMMNNNPQQAIQAFGAPDSRVVQSLLSVA